MQYLKFIIITSLLLLIGGNRLESKEIDIVQEIKYGQIRKEEVNMQKEVIGYLEFPKISENRLIKKGTPPQILDDNYVGLLEIGYDIDDDIGNLVLAGHNRKEVFSLLYKLKVGDKVNLHTYARSFKFKISEINIVDDNDFKYFEISHEKKIITLITCTKDNKQRLIIRALQT